MGPLIHSRNEGAIETMATHVFAKSQKVQTRKIGWQGYGHCHLGQKGCIAGRLHAPWNSKSRDFLP